MPVGGNRHPSDSPAVCCAITRPITNTGDVSFPTSRLYSSQAETAEPLQNKGRIPMHVSIRIKGHLDPGWQEWLEGLQIVHEPDGTSRLSGTLKDQPFELDAALARKPGTDAQRGLTRSFFGRRPPLAVGAVFLLIDCQETVWRRQDTASQYIHERRRNTVSKLQVAEFLTLDGVMEAPDQWNEPFLNEEMGMEIGGSLFQCDALLYGRRTYEEMAAAWPERTGDMADRFNSMPKFVVSTTLQEVDR